MKTKWIETLQLNTMEAASGDQRSPYMGASQQEYTYLPEC